MLKYLFSFTLPSMDLKPIIKEDFLTIQKDDTLSAFIGKLKTSDQRNALVFDHDKFVGLIEDKNFLRAKIDASKTKIANYLKKIPTASPETDLIEAACLMFQSDLSLLPIVREKKIMGVVSDLDLVKEAAKLLKGLSVGQIKFTKVPELKPNDPISSALSLMFLNRVEQIPLVDKGRLAAVLSYRDILKKYYIYPPKREGGFHYPPTTEFESDRPEIDRLPVNSFATHEIYTTTKETPLLKALDLMCQKNITDLIVVQDQKPLGLLTTKNILHYLASLKIPKNFNIRFIGLEETHLEPYQKANIQKIVSLESAKLQRALREEFMVIVHIKEYEKAGEKTTKKRKYSISLRLEYPGQIISSHKGWGGTWDIETALRKAFTNAQNKLKSKFRGDSSHRKPYE